MISPENTLNTRTKPVVKKRWFGYKVKGKVQGFASALDEDDLAKRLGYPREQLEIKSAVWDGEKFVVE